MEGLLPRGAGGFGSALGDILRTGLKLLPCTGVRGCEREPLLFPAERDLVEDCPPHRFSASSTGFEDVLTTVGLEFLTPCAGAFLIGSLSSAIGCAISFEMPAHADCEAFVLGAETTPPWENAEEQSDDAGVGNAVDSSADIKPMSIRRSTPLQR